MSANRNMIPCVLQLLMKSGSISALALGLICGVSGTAMAQAYDGTPTVVQGTVDIDRTNPGQDIFTIDTTSATINWTPFDTAIGGGEIDFLPAGFQALYQNNPALISDFVLLNRILPNDPSRPIALNGNVISQLQSAAGTVTGGTVWFYSPGGVIVGSTATFDIGSLLLTTGDTFNAPPPNSEFVNTGTSVTGTAVEIRNGATINALTEGSYVAAIAPAITQAGTVNVNGNAVYVGAERSSIRFRADGLVDVQIDVGSDGIAGVPIRHLGTTTGPASGGVGDFHRIIMAAVPKNDAITMVIGAGSELGFDIAGAADVDGNAVILSAGYNVSGSNPGSSAPPPFDGNIQIDNANFSSRLDTFASGFSNITSMGADMQFASDVRFRSTREVNILSDGATSKISFGGRLDVFARPQTVSQGQDGFGGDIAVIARDGGSISVVNDTLLSAQAAGAFNGTGLGGNGFGGDILIHAENGGNLDFGNNLTASTRTNGGTGLTGGMGRGGSVRMLATGGGSVINIGNDALLRSDGQGGGSQGAGIQGGTGFGGTVEVEASGGTNQIVIGNFFQTLSDGVGGIALAAGSKSGDAFGGLSRLTVRDGSSFTAMRASISAFGRPTTERQDIEGSDVFGGTVIAEVDGAGSVLNVDQFQLNAFGIAGNGINANGGNGTGGSVTLSASNGGTINVRDTILSATGGGGTATGAGFTAGSGTGGQINVLASDGIINFSDRTSITVIGIGGQGMMASGGDGSGGIVEMIATGSGGLINFAQSSRLLADGTGREASGGPGNGGSGTGGSVRVHSLNGARITAADEFDLAANGSGADGIGVGNSSGNGIGGSVELIADGGSISSDGEFSEISAAGFARAGSMGASSGAGQGGTALVEARGDGRMDLALLNVGVRGSGGIIFNGDGTSGEGRGGTAIVRAVDVGSIISVAGRIAIEATGRGGTLGAPVTGNITGGDGIGGTAILEVINGTINANDTVSINAGGSGGLGNGTGQAGDGIGGTARIAVREARGTLNFAGNVNLNNFSNGGLARGDNSTGGDGFGGVVELIVAAGTVNADQLNINSNGTGGDGMDGAASGNGFGGQTLVSVSGGGSINSNFLNSNADGRGGRSAGGGTSGDGTGGNNLMSVRGGSINADTLSVTANGSGGSALDDLNVSGDGFGGIAELMIFSDNASSSVNTSFASVRATGSGGIGVAGTDGAVGGNGGDGGNGTGGTARLLVDAGNARLTVGPGNRGAGSLSVAAGGFGSNGRNGGVGSTGVGGNGGDGGTGTGGTAIFGTMSDASNLSNDGIIDAGVRVFVSGSGFGGQGGDGGAGTTQGNGGNSGDAIAGQSQFIMRGGTANIDSLSLEFSTFLRSAGTGTNDGIGGVATAGSALFDIGVHTGSGAGALFGADSVFAGDRNGVNFSGVLDVIVSDSDVTFGSFSATSETGSQPDSHNADFVINNGTVNSTGSGLALRIAGDIGLEINNGAFVGSLNLENREGAGSIALIGNGTIDRINTSFLQITAADNFVSDLAIDTRSIRITAGGEVTLNRDIVGETMRFSGNNLIFAPGIEIGDINTSFASFTSTNTNTILGGDGGGNGFVLDQDEIGRVKAQNIFFTANNGDIEILDLNLRGFGAGANSNLTSNDGEFAISANGLIRVNGNVAFADMTDGNLLSLEAAPGSGIEIAADTGGIFLQGNSPGGTLLLSGDFIHVAEASLLDQLATDPNFAGRNDALAMAPSTARPDGVISARHIDFNVAERLLIQNSGTAFEFAGFHAQTGEVVISATGQTGTDLDMVIYGRLENPDGTFISNENVRDALFDPLPGSGFSSTSNVSGCLLTAAACDPVAPPLPPDPDPRPDDPPSIAPDIRDRVENEAQDNQSDPAEEEADEESTATEEEEEAIEKATSRSPIVKPVIIVDTRRLDSDVVIDEPVTGGGNPGLIGIPASGDIETDIQP